MKDMLSRLFSPRVASSKKDTAAFPQLQVRNTLSGDLEPFVPLSAREVKMYNCGPTVYDRQHIGNLRPYIFADVLRRTVEAAGYPIKQVINITDVGHLVSDADEGEDKMEASAKQKGRSAQEIAEEVTGWFFEDLDAVGVDRSHIEFPRATHHISEMLALIKTLEEKGYAYKIKDGIYFDTARFPSYGKLGGIKLSELREGARVEENPEKRNPYDFALWKFSGRKKRQQEWDSPWGKGFPGWHIECTAMIFKLLGRQIDIHTGGIDHIPVHHNNEIAQAEAATGKRYVKYWMHNEFITIEGKKVSKSLGNTIYLYQLAERGLSPRALHYLYLTAHYRSPVNFTWESIESADAAYKRLLRHFHELPEGGTPDKRFLADFNAAMAHDLDTPKALARVWEMMKDERVASADKRASLAAADKILCLGLAESREAQKLEVIPQQELPEDVQALVRERDEARTQKDFAKSDELRDTLKEMGYEVADTAEGSRVTKI